MLCRWEERYTVDKCNSSNSGSVCTLNSVGIMGRMGGWTAASPFQTGGGGSHQHGLCIAACGHYATVCPSPFNQPPPFLNPGSATDTELLSISEYS